jgi:hypothetical protein
MSICSSWPGTVPHRFRAFSYLLFEYSAALVRRAYVGYRTEWAELPAYRDALSSRDNHGPRISTASIKMNPALRNFPIVCVGGSAGGLNAYIRLLQNLPADMGVAIVIVNHVRSLPTHLHEILPHYTDMPVELITDCLLIEPNHVFIIPENRDLHVENEVSHLKPISKPRGWPDVITVFFAFPDPLVGWETGRCHCLLLRWRWGGGTVRHQTGRRYYHRAKA